MLSGHLLTVFVLHIKKPLNQRCHLGTEWMIPVICLHGFYVVALICITGAIRHVEFRFDELKELWRGILVSAFSIGIWVISYISNEIHDDIAWLQVISRFMLLLMSSILVLAFFSFSISHPLVSLLSLRRMDQPVHGTMGRALGIPDSGFLVPPESFHAIDPDVPLEKLLLNRKFRQSFMAFADSCLAGESVHFYDEVQQLDRIPLDDPTRRIYMARHIVEEYIVAGATMEVNISHKTRQDILTTTDLSQPNLFKNALNELIHLMKMSLARDYWSSTFCMKLKEDNNGGATDHELERVTGWNFSPPRLSSVHCSDNPFHQESINTEHNSSHDTGGR
ncbi:hypothetical protein Leryth_009912 [Lithospermum erythrorhizon]|nr:hypothetical protein Leryth_009912 [Lithospermum erythrorhizon]